MEVKQALINLKSLIGFEVQKNGIYRATSGTHIYNPSTQQWMFFNSDGSFNTAFKLSAEQFKNLIKTGVVNNNEETAQTAYNSYSGAGVS